MAGARHFTELTVWKLADELRVETFRLTARAAFARDIRMHGQADDAVNSVCRNIAEGFGCDTHAEFARFLGISRRSLNELHDILRGAQLKGYVSTQDVAPIHALSRRYYAAMGRLIGYLRTSNRSAPPRRSSGRPKDDPHTAD